MFGGKYHLGVNDVFSLRASQGNRLPHEQHLRLKWHTIKYKGPTSSSVYHGFLLICGGENYEGQNTYYCWPCLIIGDLSTVSTYFFTQAVLAYNQVFS